MAKRQHEEQVPESLPQDVSKKSKKQKLLPSESSPTHIDGHSPPRARNDALADSTAALNEIAKLEKEHRRALKRAKKQKLRVEDVENITPSNGTLTSATVSASNTTSDGDDISRAERKALRRAEKAARKAERSALLDGVMEGTANTSTPVSIPATKDVEMQYQEHEALSSLPQTEIDAFVEKNHLSVEDPQRQAYRPIIDFEYLGPGTNISSALFQNFAKPTPIQAACWPYLFAGRDLIGVAETGSGKTLAFALPCVKYIARLGHKERRNIKACIVSPTRELAMQIHAQITLLAKPAGLNVSLAYGGTNKDDQREALRGTNILVATPGRLNDFIQEGSVDLSNVAYLVLDEADRMLDKGFEQEVRKIISATPSIGRQTLMFTATWPQSVRELASTFMQSPVKVTIGDNASGELRANAKITQEVEVIEDSEKQSRLIQLLKQYQSGKNKQDRILVFCLYKKEATRIEEFIRRRGFPVAGIHGDLNQAKRTESLEAFKLGRVPLLVATDVAARGLDIPAVKLVVNYTFPLTVEDYVHRIGRTGRAGSDGKAVTFFTTNEKPLAGALINVLKAAKQPVPDALLKFGTTVKKKAHESYGAFYRDLGDVKTATKIVFD